MPSRRRSAGPDSAPGDPATTTRRPRFVCSLALEDEARARLLQDGSAHIAGVDEVGRGPLFGPVVAAAVILPAAVPAACALPGLTDSKQLSPAARERLEPLIRATALAVGLAVVDAETIDRINILEASRLAMRLAVEQLTPAPDHLLIDGNRPIDWPHCAQQTIVKGDARSLSIAAASVVAKVFRDRLMLEMAASHPGYGIERNMGYPTAEHLAALERLGPTPAHRRSFAPVRRRLERSLYDA